MSLIKGQVADDKLKITFSGLLRMKVDKSSLPKEIMPAEVNDCFCRNDYLSPNPSLITGESVKEAVDIVREETTNLDAE